MGIGSLEVMVEVTSLNDHKIFSPNLVSKSKRKGFMKQKINCYLDQLLEEFSKSIKSFTNS